MEYIKQHKILIITCASALLLTIGLVWLFNSGFFAEDPYEPDPIFLRNYDINEVQQVVITDEYMARLYLSEYVLLLINDLEKAYELVTEEQIEEDFPTFESFKTFVDNMKSIRFYSASLDRFAMGRSGRDVTYDVIDIANNNFIFHESEIMNYRVELAGKKR